MVTDYQFHTLGWKAFQDLCLAVAQECLQRPVQRFLPSHDAGRDGAFIGTWSADGTIRSSTIQCKFTSLPNANITLSLLEDELEKVGRLASKGLADDYIIITNHPISGVSEVAIREAFLAAGAQCCRILGSDWLIGEIQKSARLRMMVPRLYGLGDLSNILDERAYEQARMILSSMGDDLKKLVVTDAHRRSVEAISKHGFVLLLGAPASGKSTIGASLAVGAADHWGCLTVKPTSPEDLRQHINPREKQFFWVDDAWGATQYQGVNLDAWNQVLPIIAGSVKAGSKFLITSRSYIWQAARRDLKVQAFPLLTHSKVIIEVEKLSQDEKAQILYNHLKQGDQPQEIRTRVKPFLPSVVNSENFLPESARRLGSKLLAEKLIVNREGILEFFSNPSDFLLDTLRSLSTSCCAALALLFVSSGRVSSPVADGDELTLVAGTFGVSTSSVRDALLELKETLVLLAEDSGGLYWRYKHPTIAEAFGRLVAENPERIELYLRGARITWILGEVVCTGVKLQGASVTVSPVLYNLLLERMAGCYSHQLRVFITFRADKEFARRLLVARPELLNEEITFNGRVADDLVGDFLAKLHEFGLLPEMRRLEFAHALHCAAVDKADASVIQEEYLRNVLTQGEIRQILSDVEAKVLGDIWRHVQRVREEWDSSNDPDTHFDELTASLEAFVQEILPNEQESKGAEIQRNIRFAINKMLDDYEEPPVEDAPVAKAQVSNSSFAAIFRDVDE